MNVAKVTMPREVAREKLRALRRQLHKRADAEYTALEAGYQQLVEGKAVMSLEAAIRAGGFDAKDRPHIAIGRADRRQLEFTWDGYQTRATFSTAQQARRVNASMLRTVDMGRTHTHQRLAPWLGPGRMEYMRTAGYALMPIVPAEVVALIKGGTNLRHFFTLFEVEQWSDTPLRAVPDRDPYLLRHLGGDLYAVVAEWDLTELERLVMMGRRED